MITSQSFTWFISWKNLLITGAVHGNEKCWPLAINKIIEELQQWLLVLLQWTVTFIPICNPEWYQQNKRYIDQNLARIFDVYETPQSYEQKCSTIIAPYIDRCDVLLDIHSWNAKNSTFVFQDIENQDYQDLTSNLWFDLIVHQRPEMYPYDGAKDPSSYAHSQWKTAVVIECGQHTDRESEHVAYNAIKNFLHHYGLISEWWTKLETLNHVTMKKLVYMDKDKIWMFSQERKNGDPIKKWDLIGIYDDGKEVLSDIEWYIILPKHFAKPWEERFYLATDF
jgi:predicted deacylase